MTNRFLIIFIYLTLITSTAVAHEKIDDTINASMTRFVKSKAAPVIDLSVIANGQQYDAIYQNSTLMHKMNQLGPEYFELGSIMKFYTSLLTLSIIQDYHLSEQQTLISLLKDKKNIYAQQANRLIKQYPKLGQLTLHDFLNHETGFFDEQQTEEYQQGVLVDRYQPVSMIRKVRRSLASVHTLLGNHSFAYVNSNYIFIGLMDEAITGEPFLSLVKPLFSQDSNLHYYNDSQNKAAFCKKLFPAYTLATAWNRKIFHDLPVETQLTKTPTIQVTCQYDASLDDGPAGGLITSPHFLVTSLNSILNSNQGFGRVARQIFDYNIDDYIPVTKSPFSAVLQLKTNQKMSYHNGIWRIALDKNYFAWVLLGEEWGYLSGAVIVPKQNLLKQPLIISFAVNSDDQASVALVRRLLLYSGKLTKIILAAG